MNRKLFAESRTTTNPANVTVVAAFVVVLIQRTEAPISHYCPQRFFFFSCSFFIILLFPVAFFSSLIHLSVSFLGLLSRVCRLRKTMIKRKNYRTFPAFDSISHLVFRKKNFFESQENSDYSRGAITHGTHDDARSLGTYVTPSRAA